MNDTKTVKEVVLFLASKWKKIIGISFAGSVIVALLTLLMPNIYRSYTILAPNSNEMNSKFGGQLGGLAALAGINSTNATNDKSLLAIEIMRSMSFITEFINENDLKVALFAVKKWDRETGEIQIDEQVYDSKNKKWVRDVSFPQSVEPSYQESYLRFNEIFSVKNDKLSGLITISIEHESPIVAKSIVEKLTNKINTYMREKDSLEAARSIEYLNAEYEKISNKNSKDTLSFLIEEQFKKIVLTKVKPDYVFTVIEKPIVPELKSKPLRALIVVGFSIVLFATICLFYLVKLDD